MPSHLSLIPLVLPDLPLQVYPALGGGLRGIWEIFGGGGNIHHEHPLKMKFILYIVIGELFQKFFFSFVPLTSSKETFFQKICPK